MAEKKQRRSFRERFSRIKIDKMPPEEKDLHIVSKDDEIVTQLDATNIRSVEQLNDFRRLTEDRQTQLAAYDEMKQDSIIAAALEIYADDATQADEQGRILWVESDNEEIQQAANRLLDIMELPERCWKHIYLTCLYGDYYLKLYREGDFDDDELELQAHAHNSKTRVHNDKRELIKGVQATPNYEEYVEDVPDPACMFDLRKRGKTAGFIEIKKDFRMNYMSSINTLANQVTFTLGEIDVYLPDRFVHIMLNENLSRTPEEVEIDLGDGVKGTYQSARGKSILQDVYPIQKELQLLEDSLLLNRLTRSSLIRILEIEMGDMPKNEVNAYLRRVKNLIEQHISMDTDEGSYKSFNAPGPIDNVIYIPVRNGKGAISVNNLGGDVNVRDIADIDYFNNKRAGALKIPRSYLGDDMDGSGLSNGGSLTRLSVRYARTIKRVQNSYIRAVTQLLNLFFLDKKLDYVNKFTVRMASPSTQEDLERNELIESNASIVSGIMDLVESLEGDTQKKILEFLMSNVMKMTEVANFIKEDSTPEEDISINGSPVSGSDFGSPDIGGFEPSSSDIDKPEDFTSDNSTPSGEDIFTDEEFAEFEDDLS